MSKSKKQPAAELTPAEAHGLAMGNAIAALVGTPAKPRGGLRKGAGRKPEGDYGERVEKRTVALYPSTWALLERLAELEGCSQREVLEDALALMYNTPESERDLRKPEL